MIHFDQPCSQINYIQALRCTIHTWKGFCFDQEYRNAMNQCLEVVSQMGATAVIINVQSARNFEEDYDHLWTRFDWLPQVLQTNVRKIAIVVSKDFLALCLGKMFIFQWLISG